MTEASELGSAPGNPRHDKEPNTNARLELLQEIFLNASEATEDTLFNAHTMRYFQHGDSLRLCLNEILELRGPNAEDLRLDELRRDYVQTLFVKSGLLTPAQRQIYDQQSDELQKEYTDAVVAKIDGYIKARTPRQALEVGQLPPIIRKASFDDGQALSMEQFTANHLYLLVDTALIEHVKRRQLIDEHRTRSLRARITSSRGTRLAIGGAIGAASLAPEFSFVPRPDEIITQDLELGLRVLSGTIIGINLPEYIRLQYLAKKHEKKANDNYDKLSDSQEICDWALRIVYGSARYGGSSKENIATNRSGTQDKDQNTRILVGLENEFPHLNNDPGGKPYTARQALSYAARLLIERREQLDAIIDPSLSAAQQEQLFMQLCKEVLIEDVRRMKKGLNVTKIRRAIVAVLGIVPAIMFPTATSATADAVALGKDTLGALDSRSSIDPDD